jgi:hypothetical protein
MSDPNNGHVILFEYPGRATSWTYLVPRMAAAGWPAVTSINTEKVRTAAPGYMTEAQIRALVAAGWDIGVNSYDGTPFESECYGWTYDELVELMTAARDYLISIGCPGNLMAAKEGMYDQSYQAALTLFAWITWTNQAYSVWPQGSRWTIDWTQTSDSVPWLDLKAILDLVTGQPDQVVCLQVTTIVEADPSGMDTSTARLDQLIAYLAALDCDVTTVTQLAGTDPPPGTGGEGLFALLQVGGAGAGTGAGAEPLALRFYLDRNSQYLGVN